MTIEVKQIIIKSTVTNTHPNLEDSQVPVIEIENLKEMLLEQCREIITDKLDRMRER